MTAALKYTGTDNDDLAFAYCAECGWNSPVWVRFPKGYTVATSGIEKAKAAMRQHNSDEHLRRYSITLDQPVEYVDRTLQTASWWDKYHVQPGTYEITFKDYDGRQVDSPVGAAYWHIAVDAVLVESYRVNRVFTASSAQHDVYADAEPQTLHRSGHAFFMDRDDAQVFGQPVTVEAVVSV